MKYVVKLSVILTVLFLAAAAATAQPAQKPATPAYDAELAKKLGANEMGMRNYVLAMLKTGPNDATVKGDARTAAFKGHFDNMNRLADEGKLAVAGPFNDPEKKYRGLFILAVTTVAEAKALAETDPAVKAGIFVVEYVPWFGSASLMATGEIHKKIAKTNP